MEPCSRCDGSNCPDIDEVIERLKDDLSFANEREGEAYLMDANSCVVFIECWVKRAKKSV